MSSALKNLQSELTLVMGELVRICEEYRYDATPALVLVHKEGGPKSVMLTNSDSEDLFRCIKYLTKKGDVSSQSPSEASVQLLSHE